jgi:formamidopyrimidine-DNA glycosylase
MPELPEVETLARGLQREIAGRRVLSVELGKTDFMDNPAEMERELPGTQIQRVERYGKFMLLRLLRSAAADGVRQESALLVHLGMTGTMVPRPVKEPRAKHTHLVALLDDGRVATSCAAVWADCVAAGEKLRVELLVWRGSTADFTDNTSTSRRASASSPCCWTGSAPGRREYLCG